MRDRVTAKGLPNVAPIADVSKVPLQTFIPSISDCSQLREDFGILIMRVIVNKMAYFHPLKLLIPDHIEHKNSNELI